MSKFDMLHSHHISRHTALQIIYVLGHKDVHIIGMDHCFEYSSVSNDTRRINGSGPNHFRPDYCSASQTWDTSDFSRAEDKKDGGYTIDATFSGSCTIFEKADYRQFFGMNS